MPHSSPIFMKRIILHFRLIPKPIPQFLIGLLAGQLIIRWFKKLENGASTAPSKSVQRYMILEVVDDLVEVVGQSPYSRSRDPAKLLNSSKNTVWRWFTGVGNRKKCSTWICPTCSPAMIAKGCKLQIYAGPLASLSSHRSN